MPIPQGLGRYYKKSVTYKRFKELLENILNEPPEIVLNKVFELMEEHSAFGCSWKAQYAQKIIEKLIIEYKLPKTAVCS